jgi:hypothetical protein
MQRQTQVVTGAQPHELHLCHKPSQHTCAINPASLDAVCRKAACTIPMPSVCSKISRTNMLLTGAWPTSLHRAQAAGLHDMQQLLCRMADYQLCHAYVRYESNPHSLGHPYAPSVAPTTMARCTNTTLQPNPRKCLSDPTASSPYQITPPAHQKLPTQSGAAQGRAVRLSQESAGLSKTALRHLAHT